MKVTSLIDAYELSKKAILIQMPLVSVAFTVAGIAVLAIWSEVWWLGLIFLGIAGILALMCFLIVKYINKKIKELTED